jgi:hypothetical protein
MTQSSLSSKPHNFTFLNYPFTNRQISNSSFAKKILVSAAIIALLALAKHAGI